MGNQTLVLQSLGRNASGNYYCVATNSEGFALSNAVRVDVKCKYFYPSISISYPITNSNYTSFLFDFPRHFNNDNNSNHIKLTFIKLV